VDTDNPEKIAMVIHMGGEPGIATIGDWLQLDLNEWEVAIATPGLAVGSTAAELRAFELQDGQGVLLKNIQAPVAAEPSP
jgi:hypothetical protein